ncbi:hypothetical protein LUW75_13425 [Streptomyces sp. MRC013]|uniref:hypothetical protein n=1 Tax=Streptomyces sp. MRC013 TaxID=2898276 RepID=UPI002026A990|nr:hypothetical protein [Streptomyces sp. MRC013]URM90813.1 hypothetical protein LUW75_13425 [Streptomyces sp. MRC013]
MSGEPELRLPPDTARLLAEGIDKAHGELKGLTSIGNAATGNGFSGLALSAMELGHRGLADEFGAFCDRWGWGVRTLMQRGNEFAVAVGLAAGGLHEQDQYVKGTIKVVVNGVNGNPHLSEEEVQAKSWEEIRDQRPTDGADWSGESFDEAHRQSKQVWSDVAYDVNHQFANSLEDLGVYDSRERERMEALQREAFDPTDEAVRRAGGSPEDAG